MQLNAATWSTNNYLQATDMDATGLIFWEITTGKPVLHDDYGSFLNLFQLIAKHL
jgi:hypothetical protein